MGFNPKSGKKGTDSDDFYFPSGPILSKCICPQTKFYVVDYLQHTTDEVQNYECNEMSYFSSLAFFPDNNYVSSDPLGEWLQSGTKIYCSILQSVQPEYVCDLYSNIFKCPDYGLPVETTGIIKY
jgi:hypothetical protein